MTKIDGTYESLIHSWNFTVPIVVSAEKSGKISPSWTIIFNYWIELQILSFRKAFTTLSAILIEGSYSCKFLLHLPANDYVTSVVAMATLKRKLIKCANASVFDSWGSLLLLCLTSESKVYIWSIHITVQKKVIDKKKN